MNQKKTYIIAEAGVNHNGSFGGCGSGSRGRLCKISNLPAGKPGYQKCPKGGIPDKEYKFWGEPEKNAGEINPAGSGF